MAHTKVSGTGFKQNTLTKTAADTTIYVRTGGSDTDDGLTVGTALLTIQEAVNRLPDLIQHDITIDVGAGTFDGFYIGGKIVSSTAASALPELKVVGVLDAPTLGTGTASGTDDGGSIATVVDSGQTWTVNELRGMFVTVAGETMIIQENDATSITIVHYFEATASGKTYAITEHKTILDTASGALGYGAVEIINCIGMRFMVNNFKVTTGTVGFYQYSSEHVWFSNCTADGAVYGFFLEGTATKLTQVCATGGCTYGFLWQNFLAGPGMGESSGLLSYDNTNGLDLKWCPPNFFTIKSLSSFNNSAYGLRLAGARLFELEKCFIDGNTAEGIRVDNNAAGSLCYMLGAGPMVISNNGGGGITADGNCKVYLGTVTGTGNTGHGVDARFNSMIKIQSGTAITGTTGDFTINDGVTTNDWSSDLGSVGDVVINDDTNTMAERI
jgi:hypothetical protein